MLYLKNSHDGHPHRIFPLPGLVRFNTINPHTTPHTTTPLPVQNPWFWSEKLQQACSFEFPIRIMHLYIDIKCHGLSASPRNAITTTFTTTNVKTTHSKLISNEAWPIQRSLQAQLEPLTHSLTHPPTHSLHSLAVPQPTIYTLPLCDWVNESGGNIILAPSIESHSLSHIHHLLWFSLSVPRLPIQLHIAQVPVSNPPAPPTPTPPHILSPTHHLTFIRLTVHFAYATVVMVYELT